MTKWSNRRKIIREPNIIVCGERIENRTIFFSFQHLFRCSVLTAVLMVCARFAVK